MQFIHVCSMILENMCTRATLRPSQRRRWRRSRPRELLPSTTARSRSGAPLLHHQAKAKGWPLRSPCVSCRGCSDSRGGLPALAKALTPVWCDDVMNWMWQHVLSLSFWLLSVNWMWLFMMWWTESMVVIYRVPNVLSYLYLCVLKFACDVWLVVFRCCELWV